MNRILLLLCGVALFFGCSKGETTDPVSPEKPSNGIESFDFEEHAVTFDANNSVDVTLRIAPVGYDLKIVMLRLVDAGTNATASDISMQHLTTGIPADGRYHLRLTYKGAETRFTKRVELLYGSNVARTGVLEIASAPTLPTVYINASAPIVDKENWISATIRIDGGGQFEDLETTPFLIRGRGNSTWYWEKKPYAMKFDSKTKILGMPKHKRWCLIANYMDRTHMRNRTAYYIGQNSNLAYTTRNEYVELYLNGHYEGCYLLTEHIRQGSNRVDVSDEEGFLLEFDDNFDEEVRFRTAYSDIPVNVKFPDPEDLSAERLAALKEYLNQADRAIEQWSWGGTEDPFQWVDITSMVDFWIIFELMSNHEMLHPKSIYFHKEGNGKLIAGPIWDFDWETLPYHRRTGWINYNNGSMVQIGAWQERCWWVVLLKYNPTFRAAVKARWQEWYPFLKEVPKFMESQKEYIAAAVARDNKRWPNITANNVNDDLNLTFAVAVDRLQSVYSYRLEWMNTQISAW